MDTEWMGYLYLFVGTVVILLATGVPPKHTDGDRFSYRVTWWSVAHSAENTGHPGRGASVIA